MYRNWLKSKRKSFRVVFKLRSRWWRIQTNKQTLSNQIKPNINKKPERITNGPTRIACRSHTTTWHFCAQHLTFSVPLLWVFQGALLGPTAEPYRDSGTRVAHLVMCKEHELPRTYVLHNDLTNVGKSRKTQTC